MVGTRAAARRAVAPFLAALAAVAAIAGESRAQEGAAAAWRDAAALERALAEKCDAHPSIARLSTYGRSRGGRPLWAVELGPLNHPQRDRLPALLVVAGLDGQHLVGTEVVLDHLERLLRGYGSDEAVTKLLDERVIHLIPRANPDGAEAFFEPPGSSGAAGAARAKREVRGNLKSVDDDRDGALDEDGPEDLNHDGLITQMRWKDPAGTLIEDPGEPRFLRPADPVKGERGVFKAGVEAIDRDGDGECGEDGPGDVVPARNFPQRFGEFDPSAGRVPMDEPEALALGQFLFDRPAIALIVAYGLHDNVAVDAKPDTVNEQPPSFGEGARRFRLFRTMPTGIVKEDQPLHAELARRYRETTGVTSKPLLEADDGAFWTFSYFQFGVPALAMHVWSPPLDMKKPEAKPEAAPEEGKAAEGAAEKPQDGVEAAGAKPEAGAEAAAEKPEAKADESNTPAEKPEPGSEESAAAAAESRREKQEKQEKKPPADKPEADELKLLIWNDQAMGGAAFLPWTKAQHPTLGEVEVGGWKPYLRTNPPLEAVPELARKHSDFLLQLGGLLAELRIRDVKVENLGGGLFRVTAAVVNEGWLPSVCVMGERTRRPRPARLELDLGAAKLLQGDRRQTWPRIEGSGGRREGKWLLQAEPGSEVLLRLWSEKAGGDERVVALQ